MPEPEQTLADEEFERSLKEAMHTVNTEPAVLKPFPAKEVVRKRTLGEQLVQIQRASEQAKVEIHRKRVEINHEHDRAITELRISYGKKVAELERQLGEELAAAEASYREDLKQLEGMMAKLV